LGFATLEPERRLLMARIASIGGSPDGE